MTRKITDLTNQITSSQICFLRLDNEDFLRGTRPEPALDTLWHGWPIIGNIALAVGAVMLVGVLALIVYFAVWNSGLAVKVEGIIENYSPGKVNYHYTVSGVTYQKTEPVNRSSSAWDTGNVPNPVIYLSFLPSESRLDFNVEKLDLITSGFLIFFVAIIPFFGYAAKRRYRQMTDLRDDATHILEGRIVMTLPERGQVAYVYRVKSPTTAKEIGGSFKVGRLNGAFGRFNKGTTVAVLYKDDKLHTIL